MGLLPQSRNKIKEIFSKIPSYTDFMHVSYMIHWALVEFLILQFTLIPLVYLQIEKNDKIPHVHVHIVKYEQLSNLKYIIHFLQISILPSLICKICPSVSYMIGQFQHIISGRKTEKGGKSVRKLKYWSLVQP